MPTTKTKTKTKAKTKAKAKAKAKAEAKAKAKAKTIKLMVKDTGYLDECVAEFEEYEVQMNDTLSDLVAFIREDEEDAQADGEGLSELCVTTVEGKHIPKGMKIIKLIQDGFISDGSYILIQLGCWAAMMSARST
mgnify:FL=1